MSVTRTAKIALAFVGLMVGAGFATGREVIQYFLSFGAVGFWGAALAGLLMTATGAVIVHLGSYYLATDHTMVFRNVAHPAISRFLDVSVTLTLFAVGFVMFAGAGSTMQQQFGWPAWIGAGLMTLLVMVTGLMDVDKVSGIISAITPIIVVAVVLAFAYTMFHLPADAAPLEAVSSATASPVEPWWLSALNYAGLALLLGVSMCLVIGGNHPNPHEAGVGGLAGGALYTVLLLMQAVVLYANIGALHDESIPMLTLFSIIRPGSGIIMVVIVLAMIYNTAIGLFYALGRRLTADRPRLYTPVFLAACIAGYAVSFVGFSTLMAYVYPALGYIGMAMIVVLIAAWVQRRSAIEEETGRRHLIKDLLTARRHPRRAFGRREQARLQGAAVDSNVPGGDLIEALDKDVVRDLD